MKVLLIPLDDRPVTRVLPIMAGAVGGIEVITPPRELLGTHGRPPDPRRVAEWLGDQQMAMDGAVVSIDMLGHGGLIPSRRSGEPAEAVLAHLQILRRMHTGHPTMPIYAFNILQRISNADNADEEKPYWDRYGRAIFRLSQLTDAVARYGRDEDRAELARLHEQIPGNLLQDYLITRRRNLAINLAMIDWAAEGIFTYLAITQDDANPLGFPAMEQRTLAARVSELGAYERVGIYPGADEVATSLLARLACTREGLRPRVYVRYSSVRGPLVVANYEDRPLGETIKGQVLAAGGLIADTPTEADLVLMANTPAEAQAEAPDGIDYTHVHTAARNLDEFVMAVSDYQGRGKPLCLVDVAYSNGADPALLPRLLGCTDPLDLLAFAGWNTAGNTIGSALGHAYLRLLARRRGLTTQLEQSHLILLLTRLLDDWAFQAIIRTTSTVRRMEQEHGVAYLDLGTRAGPVAEQVTAELRRLYDVHLRRHVERRLGDIGAQELAIGPVSFPWNRLFEVEIPLSFGLPAPSAGAGANTHA